MILKNGLNGIPKESEVLKIINNHYYKDELLFHTSIIDNKIHCFIAFIGPVFIPVTICEVRKNFFRKYRGEQVNENWRHESKYYKIELY